MVINGLSENEVVSIFVDELYNGGALGFMLFPNIAENKNIVLTEKEYYILFNRLLSENLISIKSHPSTYTIPNFWVTEPIQLSENGFKLLTKHKSYIKYIKSENKKRSVEAFDRNIKNGNIIASLLITCVAVILTQCPKGDEKRQQKIEQGIQSISTELDSLTKVLQQTPIQTRTQPTADTLTNR